MNAIFVTSNERRIVYIVVGNKRVVIPDGESLFSVWVKRQHVKDREGFSTYRIQISENTLNPYDIFNISSIEIFPVGEADPPRTDPVIYSFGVGEVKRLLDEAEDWLVTLINQPIWEKQNIWRVYERVY